MLGRKLSAVARERSLSVTGLDIEGSDLAVNLTDDAALMAALQHVHVDVLVNCAAIVDVGLCERDPLLAWRLNARCVGVMAEYCRSKGIKFVHISTEHYFAGDGARKHDENAPVTFFNEYARSKFAGEAFAAMCPDALVLRTNIVGFRGHGKTTFAEWAFDAVMSDAEMTLFDDAYVSSIDVGHFSHALLDLVATGQSGVFNVASSEVFSKQDFILAIARHLGVELTNVRTGSVRSLPVKRPDSCGLEVGKAEAALGYKLPGLDGVADQLVKDWRKR